MAGCYRRLRTAAAALGVFGSLMSAPDLRAFDVVPNFVLPTPTTLNPTRLRYTAEAAERVGLWELALENYLGLYFAAGPSAEVRDKVRLCFKHSAQVRRHRDPAFQQYLHTLPAADALNLYADALGKLASLHTDKDRATTPRLFALGLQELDRALGDPMFRSIHADRGKVLAFRESLRSGWENRLPPGPKEARQAARDLAAAAQDQAGVSNPSAVVMELLCGACTGLDEFTTYLPPGVDPGDLTLPAAEFAAYGVATHFDGSGWVIDSVAPNSWAAWNTKLRKGQRVLTLDGRPFALGVPAESYGAVSPFGFAVEVSDPDHLSSPEIVRLPVPAPTAFAVDSGITSNGIGYIRVSSFREETPRELEEEVAALRGRGMRGLVLDLRGNPGGSFPAAVETAKRFLSNGLIVATQGPSPEFAGRTFSAANGAAAWSFPVAVLVDTRTMSAAEVVAAALKENGTDGHGRAVLVGMPTFGKGVVQSAVRLNRTDGPDGTGGVLVTTVATLTGPKGTSLNNSVVPHLIEADPTRQLELAVEQLTALLHSSH